MIIRADAKSLPLADECVQVCITSPPYWALRSYGIGTENGEIGLERSIADYIDTLVGVFREVKRVLHPTGICLINIGDSYAGGGNSRGNNSPLFAKQASNKGAIGQVGPMPVSDGLKPKDLCLIPERLALALQADGWWVRSRIAWCKDNPMPESCVDRPTSAWEHVYLLAKSPRYYWDAEAVREPNDDIKLNAQRISNGPKGQLDGGLLQNGRRYTERYVNPAGRNLRNWWQINPEPSSETYCVACDLMYDRSPVGQVCVRCKGKLTAHYAAFPRKLVETAIKAGTPERGVCAACLTPWVRVIEIDKSHREGPPGRGGNWQGLSQDAGVKVMKNGYEAGRSYPRKDTGWRPQCSCNAPTQPALCFDPFGGTGTTGIVAESLGRRWVITELSWPYCRYSQRRTSQRGLFA